jgi:hypothetical protein
LFWWARNERWWFKTSFSTWVIKPSLNIVGLKWMFTTLKQNMLI